MKSYNSVESDLNNYSINNFTLKIGKLQKYGDGLYLVSSATQKLIP